MHEWGLIADSSCDLSALDYHTKEVRFATVPLKILVGEQQFIDLPGTDPNAMLEAMHHEKGAVLSACPSPDDFAEQMRQTQKSIVVTISSNLSGTYNSALQGMGIVLDESSQHQIHVVDSRSTAGTMVLILRRLQALIAEGLPFEEIVTQIEAYRDEMIILFSLASFDMLIKTGRMSAVTGLLASALGIRAVARNTDEGKIQVLEKPRGERRAIERMVDLMPEVRPITAATPVVITHCNNPRGAEALCALVAKTHGIADITIATCACLTSFYAGDQGLLMAF